MAIIWISAILVILLIGFASAQDIDPEYYCLKNISPFCRAVDQQKILDIIQEICDWDESYCVIGNADPDFLEPDNDTGE